MKTTKEQRSMLREVYARSREMGPTINPPPVMVDLIDDIDTLESRLSEAMALLERAENYVEWSKRTQESVSKAETTEEDEWLSDLARMKEKY